MKQIAPTNRSINKIITGMLYVLQEWSKDGVNAVDNHTLFKTFYTADKASISQIGSLIFGDTYVRMQFGPVPHYTRDIINPKNTARPKYNGLDVKDVFEISTANEFPLISAKIEPDMGHLSGLDVQFLDNAIAEMKTIGAGKKGFDKRTMQTHDLAWERAEKNGLPIRNEDILEAGKGRQALLDGLLEREALKASIRA